MSKIFRSFGSSNRWMRIFAVLLFVMVLVSFGFAAQSTADNLKAKIAFMKKEIVYLDDNFTRDNIKWADYKAKVAALAGRAASDSDAEVLLKEAAKLHESAPLRLPSGPAGTGEFGAYYVNLKFSLSWDQAWHVSGYPDVVVRFDDYDHRFVFWRGTSYIPCWATYDGAWYTNEFFERRGYLGGCSSMCEPMSDKQARYSHARIIESTPARVVVHWRYSPVDLEYVQPYRNKMTGWGDCVDEYYTIYPDSVGVRKATIHTGSPLDDWIEYQEGIVVNQPHTIPEDNINYDAVTFANLEGQSKTYIWTEKGGPELRGAPDKPCIQVINFKNTHKPFTVVNPDSVTIKVYGGHGKNSFFNWWNHWPVAQEKSDTTRAESAIRPSHSSLTHIEWDQYSQEGISRTWIMMNGMTDKPAAELVGLAKSWLYAPELKLTSSGYKSEGYDQSQRAYKLNCNSVGRPSELEFVLAASEESSVVNPAFVVEGWGKSPVSLKINGKDVKLGKDFRVGFTRKLQTEDLIIWVKVESTKPLNFSIIPKSK